MQDSHTHVSADDIAGDPSPLRLVSAGTAGLPEWLAGRVDEHLAVFAAHMTQGLLAADAVGSHAGVRMLGVGTVWRQLAGSWPAEEMKRRRWLGAELGCKLVPGDDFRAVTLTDTLNQGAPLFNLLRRGCGRLGGRRS
jgi:hypothetical protein